MHLPSLPRWAPYAIAAVITLATLWLRHSLGEAHAERPQLILLVFPIVVSALLGGWGPGITATLTACIGVFFAIPPVGSFSLSNVHDRLPWAMLTGSGVLVSLLSGYMHRARRREQTLRLEQEQTLKSLRDSEVSHRTIIDALAEGVLVYGRDGLIRAANPSAARILGLDLEHLLGSSQSADGWMAHDEAMAPIPPDALPVARSFRRGEVVRDAVVGLRKPDGFVWLSINSAPIYREGDAAPESVLVSLTDITERKRAEMGLKLAASVFEHSHEGIAITDADANILDVNQALSQITGYEPDELRGHNPSLFHSGRQDHAFYEGMWNALLSTGHWRGELWNRRKDGEVFPENLTISAVQDGTGATTHYVGFFEDITEAKRHEEQLRHVAHYDILTGVPNRRLLADRMRQAIAQTDRSQSLMAVCYLDLDGFKPINDKFGHEAGDHLLVEMARRLLDCLRGGDTVARLGGDEFVLLLLGLTDRAEAESALQRILAAVNRPVQLDQLPELTLSASLGVALYPLDNVDPDTLLRHADQSMYLAKQSGKNRCHFFDPEKDRQAQALGETIQRIREAYNQGEFVLHYQPKVNMRLGTLEGAEALIRWNHPTRGLLPPSEFLPYIEEHELIANLGRWVVDTALRQMRDWGQQGFRIPVSVNIAAWHLQGRDFVPWLEQLLQAYPDVSPALLELEVLETTALEDMAHVSHIVEACRRLGVGVSLDDFGTGYSSLTYFKRLPVSTLKIDQSFIRDMLWDPEDLAIVEGVIGLTAAFRRRVIAEGVESIRHGVMLLSLGCELGQGYGIAHPMPPEQLPIWAQGWKPDPSWVNETGIRWQREDLPLVIAENNHRRWVDAIGALVQGFSPKALPELDPLRCRFGQWYAGIGGERYGRLPEFQAIAPLHREVHELGLEILSLRDQGRVQEAEARFKVLELLREDLLAALGRLLLAALETSPGPAQQAGPASPG